MKLRLHGESIRFRLSVSETARLIAGEAVTCETPVLHPTGLAGKLQYGIAPSPVAPESRVDLGPHSLTLVLCPRDLATFAVPDNETVRIHRTWTDEFGAVLASEVSVEKDRREK